MKLNSNFTAALIVSASLVYAGWAYRRPPKAIIQEIPIRARLDLPGQGAINAAGPLSAPVVVVEYGDNMCQFCGMAYREVEPGLMALAKAGKIRFISKELPLTIHPTAKKASEAALCAGDQYWRVRGAMRSNALDQLLLMGGGVDLKSIGACLDSGLFAEAVHRSEEEAKRNRITATPTFIIGRVFDSGELVGSRIDGAAPKEFIRNVLIKFGALSW